MPATLCFVTPGHIASNPRLVKEASAASEAGYDVHIVFCQYLERLISDDEALVDKHSGWSVTRVRYTTGSIATTYTRVLSGVRQRIARWLFDYGIRAWYRNAHGRVHRELYQASRQIRADLYIAHNLAALPAAAKAAENRKARLGFDAEDYHRGELPSRPEYEEERRLIAHVEEEYIPRCDYVTAASDGIAEAYAEVLDIERPQTILNVFPWSQREVDVPPETLRSEVPDGRRSMYWFSQTIGPDRGLEDALHALPHLPHDVILSLRGKWSPGYEETFRGRAKNLGVADRIHHLDLVPPNELIPRTAEHDLGLALEHPSVSTNRAICLTNKLFTYLVAGLPFVATDTPGQRPIIDDLPEVTESYQPGQVKEFAAAASKVIGAEGVREQALHAARERYCWEVEKIAFLEVVSQTVC
jgi:glycosyltransferase involved in cell wall biosynthesis